MKNEATLACEIQELEATLNGMAVNDVRFDGLEAELDELYFLEASAVDTSRHQHLPQAHTPIVGTWTKVSCRQCPAIEWTKGGIH